MRIGSRITGDDRRLFVTNQDDDSVSVIDPHTLSVVATIPVGAAPRAVATSALAGLAYVAVAKSVAVLDPARDTLTGRIVGIAAATTLAISPDGRWGFAAGSAGPETHTPPPRVRISMPDKPASNWARC